MDSEHGQFLLSHNKLLDWGVSYLYDKWHGSVIYEESITDGTKKKVE